MDDVPKNVEVDGIVAVDEAVPQADHVRPRDLRTSASRPVGKPGRRFADDFQQPHER